MPETRPFTPPQLATAQAARPRAIHAPPPVAPIRSAPPSPRPGPVAIAQPKPAPPLAGPRAVHLPPPIAGRTAPTLQGKLTIKPNSYEGKGGEITFFQSYTEFLKGKAKENNDDYDKIRLSVYRMIYGNSERTFNNFDEAYTGFQKDIISSAPKPLLTPQEQQHKSLFEAICALSGSTDTWDISYPNSAHNNPKEPNISKAARDIIQKNGQYKEGSVYFRKGDSCVKVVNAAHASYSFAAGTAVTVFVVKGTTKVFAIGAHISQETYSVKAVQKPYQTEIDIGATATFSRPNDISNTAISQKTLT